jgi:hypothetical protein
MRFTSVFSLLATWALGLGPPASAYDTIGAAGCVAPACVLANSALRFGTGAENSVNAYGLFQQPWYYSPNASTWYKLTYSGYPLDTAIGVGTGGSHWSGATSIFDLYSLTPTNTVTDYSGFIATAVDAIKTTGYGKVVSNRTYVLSGNTVILQNTFSLGHNDSFVKVKSRLINISPSTFSNVILWVGTRDDYVGVTDINTKTRGNLGLNGFTPLTAVGQSSNAIMITNTNEGVLFYSDTPGVMTAYARCCMFSDVYNTNPQTLAPATATPTDGSYTAVLPLGSVQTGGMGEIVWYYGAGAISILNTVSQTVAEAQAAETSPSVTPSVTASMSASASATASVSPSESVSVTGSRTVSVTPSATVSESASVSSSASATASVSPSASVSPTASVSLSPSLSASPSASLTLSITPTSNATGTPLRMVTDWPSATETSATTPTHSPTFFLTPYPSIFPTVTRTSSPRFMTIPYPSSSPTPVDAATLQKLTDAQKNTEERTTTVSVAVGGAAVGAISMTVVAIAIQKMKAQIDLRRLARRGPRTVGGSDPLSSPGAGRRNEEGVGYLELNEEEMARALELLRQAGIRVVPVARA